MRGDDDLTARQAGAAVTPTAAGLSGREWPDLGSSSNPFRLAQPREFPFRSDGAVYRLSGSHPHRRAEETESCLNSPIRYRSFPLCVPTSLRRTAMSLLPPRRGVKPACAGLGCCQDRNRTSAPLSGLESLGAPNLAHVRENLLPVERRHTGACPSIFNLTCRRPRADSAGLREPQTPPVYQFEGETLRKESARSGRTARSAAGSVQAVRTK